MRSNARNMPIFYFDRTENGEVHRGEYGMEFATLEEARRDALRALAEIVRDEPPNDPEGFELTIHIRENDPEPILSVSLVVREEERDQAVSVSLNWPQPSEL